MEKTKEPSLWRPIKRRHGPRSQPHSRRRCCGRHGGAGNAVCGLGLKPYYRWEYCEDLLAVIRPHDVCDVQKTQWPGNQKSSIVAKVEKSTCPCALGIFLYARDGRRSSLLATKQRHVGCARDRQIGIWGGTRLTNYVEMSSPPQQR